MVGQLTQTLINISRSIPKEEAATKIAKCWRGYQVGKKTKGLVQEARTELSSVKNTLATITRESQENNRRITFNDIHHSYKQILGLNEAEELVAKQHKTLHPEDAAAVTNKLETCVTADKPVEEAFKNVIFKNIHSYEEFLKTLPADKRAASATQRIGKLPFEEELPGFKDKLAEFVAKEGEKLQFWPSIKTGSKEIDFHYIGSGELGYAYSFEVGSKKYVLKTFKKEDGCWMSDKRTKGVDQLHGYLAETNRLFYLQAKHPEFAKHFAKLHYADLGGETKFSISECVEKAEGGQGNLKPILTKLESLGFKCTDQEGDNLCGSKIIDAGGIYIKNDSKYPSPNWLADNPIHIDKSESKDKIHVSDYEPARYSNNTPLVVSVPHSKSSRVSKLADPQHPLHQQYLRYAGQAYTKPAHISVFVPSSDSASK